MDRLSLNDVIQMYDKSLIKYKNKLYYVLDINRNDDDNDSIDVHMRQLSTKENFIVPFNRKRFSAPGRIGYVNYNDGAWFVSRKPVRMFKIGLDKGNIGLATPPMFLGMLTPPILNKCFQDAHDNKYPSLYKAWSLVKDKALALCAFDHQFAICNSRNIYFKNKKVGTIPKGHIRKSNIQWDNGWEFLIDVLEPDYEKTVRTFK